MATFGPVELNRLRNLLQETINAASLTQSTRSSPTIPPGLRLQKFPEQTLLEKEGLCPTSTVLWTWRRIPWPDPALDAGLKKEDEEDWRVLATLATVCGVLGASGFVVQKFALGPAWLPALFYTLAMIAGGWDAARETLPNVRKLRLDIHFLMLAVAVGASFIGAHAEAALLLFLFSGSNALEHYALHRTRREINALFALAPRTAQVRDSASGSIKSVPIDDVRPGDVLVLRPGDIVAADAEVISGESAADESSLTGESTPVPKQKGDTLLSGTINLWGALDARCLRPAAQSSLQKIISLIREARNSRAASQRLIDRYGPAYTYAILLFTAVMFLVWVFYFKLPPFRAQVLEDGSTVASAFYRAMTLLVVVSPCALVLSIPSAILAAIAAGARRGILFRGGAAIEKLSEIDTVAMDKTGTLTTGELHITAVESFPPGHEERILKVAFSLEIQSTHPIARAITQRGKQLGWEPLPVSAFQSLTGSGLKAEVEGIPCLLGRRELLLAGPLASWAEKIPVPPPDTTEVWVMFDDLLGRILLTDTIRTASSAVLAEIHRRNLRTLMLTGDRRETAEAIARQLGVQQVFSALTPEDKLRIVQKLSHDGYRVAMIGDGVNDAPCLAAAYVSVAMGARGSDAALEQSEVVLMNDKIENFLTALDLGRATRQVIHQNIALALGTIVLMLIASLVGVVPITLAVIAHEGSTVLVCLNSLRLLLMKFSPSGC